MLLNRNIRHSLCGCFIVAVSLWVAYFCMFFIVPGLRSSDGIDHNYSVMNFTPVIVNHRKIQQLRKLAQNRNQRATDKLRALTATKKKFRFIIVVQVHDRITYIKALIDSLANTQNISEALVVFSHDVIDEGIDQMITENSDFESFSKPLLERSSEGRSEAAKRKCNSFDHPDSYGNYRAARLSQVKLHWWWKFQFVFTRIQPIFGEEIPVVFAEEDHYFLPDALVVLDLLFAVRRTACEKECDKKPVISIAHHKVKAADTKGSYQKYATSSWIGSRDNIGLVMDREQFLRVNSCANVFCEVDDYNWDWSLYFLIKSCLRTEYPMILPLAPRVLHIGDCGGIHHSKSCSPQDSVRKAKEVLERIRKDLFPEKLERSAVKFPKHKDSNVNGGWGDLRDVGLCRNITLSFQA